MSVWPVLFVNEVGRSTYSAFGEYVGKNFASVLICLGGLWQSYYSGDPLLERRG
jgi:hypothetical protein